MFLDTIINHYLIRILFARHNQFRQEIILDLIKDNGMLTILGQLSSLCLRFKVRTINCSNCKQIVREGRTKG